MWMFVGTSSRSMNIQQCKDVLSSLIPPEYWMRNAWKYIFQLRTLVSRTARASVRSPNHLHNVGRCKNASILLSHPRHAMSAQISLPARIPWLCPFWAEHTLRNKKDEVRKDN